MLKAHFQPPSVFHFVSICGYLFCERWKGLCKPNKLHWTEVTSGALQRNIIITECIHRPHRGGERVIIYHLLICRHVGWVQCEPLLVWLRQDSLNTSWCCGSSQILLCVRTDYQLPAKLHHHQFHVSTILWRIPHHRHKLLCLQLRANRFLSADVSIFLTSLLFDPQEQTGSFFSSSNADELKFLSQRSFSPSK